jgi:hypothetical protein
MDLLSTAYLTQPLCLYYIDDYSKLSTKVLELYTSTLYCPYVINICRMITYGQKLQEQLHKSLQTCLVAPRKKFIIGVTFVLLHLEVTSSRKSDTADKP